MKDDIKEILSKWIVFILAVCFVMFFAISLDRYFYYRLFELIMVIVLASVIFGPFLFFKD